MGFISLNHSTAVMPALVAGIHVFFLQEEDVDGRNKSGHDARVLYCGMF